MDELFAMILHERFLQSKLGAGIPATVGQRS